MAETERSLALRVQAHLRAAGKRVPALGDIVPLISTALEETARMIAKDKDRRHELRVVPAFSVTVVDGEADITTLLAAPYRLLSEFFQYADVRDEQGRRLFYLARDVYEMEQPPGYGYFSIEGNLLLARLEDEDPATSDFAAAITGNFAPTADELPASCIPDVVLLGARLADGPPAEGQ